jgi:hypothetical protein
VIGRPLPRKKERIESTTPLLEHHGIIIRQTDPLAKLKVVGAVLDERFPSPLYFIHRRSSREKIEWPMLIQ